MPVEFTEEKLRVITEWTRRIPAGEIFTFHGIGRRFAHANRVEAQSLGREIRRSVEDEQDDRLPIRINYDDGGRPVHDYGNNAIQYIKE